MKMKEFGPEGGLPWRSLGSANVSHVDECGSSKK